MTTMPSGELNKFLQTLAADCSKKPPSYFRDREAEIRALDVLLQDIIRSKEHTRSLPAVAQVLRALSERRLKNIEAQAVYNKHVNAVFSEKEVDLHLQRLTVKELVDMLQGLPTSMTTVRLLDQIEKKLQAKNVKVKPFDYLRTMRILTQEVQEIVLLKYPQIIVSVVRII